jgi:hypothetical protein
LWTRVAVCSRLLRVIYWNFLPGLLRVGEVEETSLWNGCIAFYDITKLLLPTIWYHILMHCFKWVLKNHYSNISSFNSLQKIYYIKNFKNKPTNEFIKNKINILYQYFFFIYLFYLNLLKNGLWICNFHINMGKSALYFLCLYLSGFMNLH